MSLNELRNEIDEIDRQVRELFVRRMTVSAKVAETKAKTGDKILKPEREKQVINTLTEWIAPELKVEYSSFLKKFMEISRTFQYRKMLDLGTDFRVEYAEEEPGAGTICYQGLAGSYSEITAKTMFPNSENYHVATFEEVFNEVSSQKADIGVVPLENTTAGSVNEVYDLLLDYDLYINYSSVTKVEHCLAALLGADLEQIKEVYSHPQAIAQSREFLKNHGIIALESRNTAVAASMVAQQPSFSVGAICSLDAAKKYGLAVLEEGINHNKKNETKFVAVSKILTCKPEHNKIGLVFACPHRAGSLAGVLGIFADHGVNLTEIHSRPDGKNPWEYLFYVDFTGNLMEETMKALLYQLSEELPFLKILGSYVSDQEA